MIPLKKSNIYCGFSLFLGDVVDEIHQTFNPWVKQIIRINKGEDNVEFDWIVGPIPIE